MKCEHERSVHLFIDSLLNERETAVAYRCGSSDMFDRGVCLCCRKRRCNAVGYGVSRVRQAGSVQMYTRTRASMPFRGWWTQPAVGLVFAGAVPRWNTPQRRWSTGMFSLSTVYHYQLKIHFSGQVKRSEMEPSLTVSLHGTKGEAEDLELRL